MKRSGTFNRLLQVPMLTPARMSLAMIVAVLADGLQMLLGPFGWVFGDPIIDVVAMLLASRLLGFHWLFLPSFILELVPVADEFPSWTACVIAVILLRKRQQRRRPAPSPEAPVIDV